MTFTAFSAVHIPLRLEPPGLAQADGKRSDGITLVPWKCGQLHVWDATCPDTYAPSYASIAVAEAGAVANQAECKKRQKYAYLGPGHIFTLVAIEFSGVFGTETKICTRLWSLPLIGFWRVQCIPLPPSKALSSYTMGKCCIYNGLRADGEIFCVTYVYLCLV